MEDSSDKILIIDDDELFSKELSFMLERENWSIEIVNNALDGLSKMQKNSYDVILLDIMMPGMSGLELLRKIKSKELIGNFYIIVLTGYTTVEKAIDSLRLGARDFIKKPEVRDQIIERIKKGLEWQNERRLREQLQKQKESLQEELRILARMVGHDIGGSYHFILTSRVRRISEFCKGNDKVQESIQVIHDTLGRIAVLSEDLQYFADSYKIKSSRMGKELDVCEILKHAAQKLRDKNPKIEIVRECNPLPLIQGSDIYIERVFLNIIFNASKAMLDGGTLTLKTVFDGGEFAKIMISDTGIGIPKDSLDKIFQIDYTNWEYRDGTGLGLAICKNTIENHGGRIEVESEVGKGTTFTIYLPVAKVEAE